MAQSGVIALVGALCGATRFSARESTSKFDHLLEARNALKQEVTYQNYDTLGGGNLLIDGDRACVIKENSG